MTRAEMNTRIEELEQDATENAATIETLSKGIEDAKATIEAANDERNKAIESANEIQAKFDEQAGALAEITAERDSQAELIAGITKERDTALNALANPQNIDAAMIAAGKVEADKTDAEIDALESAALAKEKTFATKKEQYEAMEPGPERIAFLNANKTAIFNGE